MNADIFFNYSFQIQSYILSFIFYEKAAWSKERVYMIGHKTKQFVEPVQIDCDIVLYVIF